MPFRPLPMLLSHPKAWIKNILHSQRWLIYAWFICLGKQKSFLQWLVRPLTLYQRYGHALTLSTCRKQGGFALYFIQKYLLNLKLSGPLIQRTFENGTKLKIMLIRGGNSQVRFLDDSHSGWLFRMILLYVNI